MTTFEWLVVILLFVVAVASIVTATCWVLLYRRTLGVNLRSMEMDIYALWLRKEAGDYRVGRQRK